MNQHFQRSLALSIVAVFASVPAFAKDNSGGSAGGKPQVLQPAPTYRSYQQPSYTYRQPAPTYRSYQQPSYTYRQPTYQPAPTYRSYQPYASSTNRTSQSTQQYIAKPQPVIIDRHSPPPGTVAACGITTGYYRPQPYTLSAGFPPQKVSSNGNYYAPTGSRQQYWNQYTPSTNTYGPKEPNPFDKNGNLSIPRATNHVTQTRVIPWFQRLFSR